MAGEFFQGVQAAEAQKQTNPFNAIIGRFQDSFARKMKERQEEDRDLKDLNKTLQVLSYKHNYDTELAKARAEEDRETERLKQEGELKTTQAIIDTFEGARTTGDNNLPPGTTFTKGGLTIPLNQKMTEGESKSLGMSGALLDQINEMKEVVESDIKLHKKGKTGETSQVLGAFPLGLGTAKGQDYQRLRKSILTTITYLRSGAQINDQEFARFSSLLPTARINDETDLKQLDRFINEFSQVQGRIKSGAKWDKNQKTFIGGQQEQGNIPSFNSEQEAEASGVKGEVIINGRKARIE